MNSERQPIEKKKGRRAAKEPRVQRKASGSESRGLAYLARLRGGLMSEGNGEELPHRGRREKRGIIQGAA